MHLKSALVLTVSALFCLTACGPKVPECNGSDVTATIKTIVHDRYKKDLNDATSYQGAMLLTLTYAALEKVSSVPDAQASLFGYDKNAASEKMALLKYILETLVKAGDEKESLIENAVASQTFSVNTVRTISKDEQVKTCKCKAKLDWKSPTGSNLSQEIDYLAQYTEDKKQVYVTVESLKSLFDL